MAARDQAVAALLAERNSESHWVGELSSSPLSTATAVCALSIWSRNGGKATSEHARLIEGGLHWLAEHANEDGGWGDTDRSFSNISTTTLVWAAFGAATGVTTQYSAVMEHAEQWLTKRAGSLAPEPLANAIAVRYGKDRTFSVPILTMCALTGRLGTPEQAWRIVRQLPFELAVLPHQFYGALRLPVVSYALPALIAIGQVRHHFRPTRNPLTRALRNLSRRRSLEILATIQPENGGFLEATPLTSFVTMSLAGMGLVEHPVTRRGIAFLAQSARPDGSWPIDTNLATWLTTLSVNALLPQMALPDSHHQQITEWLLRQQYRVEHPYTHAAPGGWSWTNLPGGVPDADDTGGAVLALRILAESFHVSREVGRAARSGRAGAKGGSADFQSAVSPTSSRQTVPAPETARRLETCDTADWKSALREQRPAGCELTAIDPQPDEEITHAASTGIVWLLDLQNRDGGIPTFCRGWGALPFDRSSPDLTTHAVRAWLAWQDAVSPELKNRIAVAVPRAIRFLARTQRPDGAWLPLWFGHQESPDDENPLYGTARVLSALAVASRHGTPGVSPLIERAVNWLMNWQNPDGGWSGARGAKSSVEETALAVEALAELPENEMPPKARQSLERGVAWLIERVNTGRWREPSPIGFYFARLWYYEKLYPMIFTVAALNRVTSRFGEVPSRTG